MNWHRRGRVDDTKRDRFSPDERLGLVKRNGTNSLAFLSLYEGWEYYDSLQSSGFVAFERHAGVALVCGEPVVAKADREGLLAEFVTFCKSQSLRPAFAGACEAFARSGSDGGWACLKVGEEPWFEVDTYAPRGNRAKKVRSAANQARKNGVTVEAVAPGMRAGPAALLAMAGIMADWRQSRKVSGLGFTLRLHPLEIAQEKFILLAWKDSRLVGFLTCMPVASRNAYGVEDLIRRPGSPNGVSELLLLAALEECRGAGVGLFTLGLAPLRGAAEQPFGLAGAGRLLGFTGKHLNAFYNFRALAHFKGKFAPTRWEGTYLVYRKGELPRCLFALVLAFTPGRFGAIRTLLSRWRLRTRFPLLNQVGGWAALTAVTAVGAFAAVHAPAVAPFALTGRDIGRLTLEVGETAREHIFFDGVIAAALSAAYLTSARSH